MIPAPLAEIIGKSLQCRILTVAVLVVSLALFVAGMLCVNDTAEFNRRWWFGMVSLVLGIGGIVAFMLIAC